MAENEAWEMSMPEEAEPVPRLFEALAGKKVVGAAAGCYATAAWTDQGELFTFGMGSHGNLGHGGKEHEFERRLVEALAGKRVIGASAGERHTVVWTEAGESSSPLGMGAVGGWATERQRPGHGGIETACMCQCRWRRWQGRKGLVQLQVIFTPWRGPVWENSSPLGMDTMGSWATEGRSVSL